IIWNLWKLQEKGECDHSLIVFLKNKPLSDMPKEKQNFKYKVLRGGGRWILTKLMPYLFFAKEKPDVLFSPSHYTVPFSPVPRICSIMDLGYLEFSGQFTKKVFWQLKWWTAISIYVSKYIISISESTKKDIVRHYKFASGKVYVTPLSHDITLEDLKVDNNDVRRVKKRYSIVDDYVLYIGTLKPSKNIEGLIEAFSRFQIHDSRFQLVIAGKKGWMYDPIMKKVTDLGLADRVIFTDYVTDADKMALRLGAKVFVQPSFWEGFGIDTLSAMYMGIPVVVSSAGSLSEVVGSAGIMVDPQNTESIAQGIRKVLTMSQKEYNKLVAAGIAQASKFSWGKTARETLKIITKVNN
ncbi:MAG: glycosyltransferase family 1 protein, partial [Patescibacteria group bacterium]